MTLDEVLRSDRHCNLDALRSLLVITGFVWLLVLASDTPAPLDALMGRPLGGWAIGLFFLASGLLIAGLSERCGKVLFGGSRTRQICRALSAAFLITLTIAIACGSITAFSEMTAWYFRAFSRISLEHLLSGTFAANPLPNVVNGPLLCLFYEVGAYCVCASIVWVIGPRNAWEGAALLALTVSEGHFFGLLPAGLSAFAALFATFALGVAALLGRRYIHLSCSAAIVGILLPILLPWELAIALAGLIALTLKLNRSTARFRSDAAASGANINVCSAPQVFVYQGFSVAVAALAIQKVLFTSPLTYLRSQFAEQPRLGVRRMTL